MTFGNFAFERVEVYCEQYSLFSNSGNFEEGITETVLFAPEL